MTSPKRFKTTQVLLVSLMLLGFCHPAFGDYKIIGRVVDADSNAVANASVRLWGLDTKETDEFGYVHFNISNATAKQHGLKPGRDLFVNVEKEGMVTIEPPEPEQKIRLPENPDTQSHFRIVMCRKGSLACLRSERMLEYFFNKRLQAAIAATEKEAARQLELATEAARLGLTEEQLQIAVDEYKEGLRTSTDLNKRGLALLDDANSASEYKARQQNLDQAKMSFREAGSKNLKIIAEGKKAEGLQPEIDFNLGLAFFEEARYDSALVYFTKADSAGPGNADRLNWLGGTLEELAQYERAFQIFEQASTIVITQYGRDHPNVARGLNNIALVLEAQGDYAGALEKYDEALKIFEGYFSRNHPNMAIGLNNIALVLEAKGDYAGALAKSEEALKIFEDNFGRNHPNVATGLNTIAGVLVAQGDYAGALEKYDEALKIDEGYFSSNHPKVATTLNNIAGVLVAQGDYAGALAKSEEALKIFEGYFSRNHPNMAIGLNNIALVLEAKGDYAGALEKYDEALKIDERHFGRNHPAVAIKLYGIANVLKRKGVYDGALAKFNEALAIDEKYFGPNHPEVAKDLDSIAQVLELKGDRIGALGKFNEAMNIYEAYFGRNHLDVARIINNIASVLTSEGNYAEALERLNEALFIAENYWGQNHPNVGTVLNNIGLILAEQGEFAGALEKHYKALRISEAYFGRNHPEVATALNNIAAVLESQGDYAGALAKYDEALAIFMEFLGPDHPNTKTVRENRNQAWWESLSEHERWFWQTQFYLAQLKDSTTAKTEPDMLALLNQIGVCYVKQAKADSALSYLNQAMLLAKNLNNKQMIGTVLNNLGAAYKISKNWPLAEGYLRQSIQHNRAVVGDSAAVLAYSYFHLGGMLHAQAQADSARYYAEKSHALAQKHGLKDLLEEIRALLESIEEVTKK